MVLLPVKNALIHCFSRKQEIIEADPELYATVRSKNRRTFTVNACLSPEPHPALVSLVDFYMSLGMISKHTN